MADRGEDVSRYFTNKGRIVQPVRSVNVPFPPEMLGEIDATARKLRLTRPATIRALIRVALDRQPGARHSR